MSTDIKNLINIDKNEVLRYLQYKGQEIDKDLNETIDNCIEQTIETINPRYILRVYSIKKSIRESESGENIYTVEIEGSDLKLVSKDIYNLLKDSDECIIMAATLGINIDKEIKKHTYTELTKGIIIDSCATTAIEEVCDVVQNQIENDLLKENKFITSRYSPGYGDLSIEINSDIINLLGAQRKIGLTITQSNIMIPRKSVVAIMGVSNTKKTRKKSCVNCANYDNCQYKREGDGCGN